MGRRVASDHRTHAVLGGWVILLTIGSAGRVSAGVWVVRELPTLGGVGPVEAWAVNSAGVVCGHGPAEDGSQTVFRYDGTMTSLPHLEPANPHSVARDINAAGIIGGFSWNAAGRERAVFWAGMVVTEIPAPAGVNPDRHARVNALNDGGVMVGYYNDDNWIPRPFYYDGTVHDLSPVLAAQGLTDRAYADDVNNNNRICGHARVGQYWVWTYDIDTGTLTIVGTMNPLFDTFPRALNDAGHWVGRGQSDFGSPYHSLFHDGTFRILDPSVTDAQWAWGINNSGRIVGTAGTGTGTWSWYSDGPGEGSLTPITLPGWTAVAVEGINDCNVIVGQGKNAASGDDTRAFVIAPAADSDADRDVDLADWAAFQRCHGKPAGMPGDCWVFDADGDGDVALDDYAVLADRISGPAS